MSYYNLPTMKLFPQSGSSCRFKEAIDLVGSPSSTTIDQDEQSASTSPTNQEIQSQVTHQYKTDSSQKEIEISSSISSLEEYFSGISIQSISKKNISLQ
ncbi:hypothetical protein Tco_1272919 [Tanacetum coccineum]